MRRLGRAVAGHEDDAVGQARPAPGEGEEQRVAGHLRKVQIEEHQVDVGLVEHPVGQVGIAGGDHVAAHAPEHPLECTPDRRLVIDDQHPGTHEAAARLIGWRYRPVTAASASSVESETRSSPAVIPKTVRRWICSVLDRL